MPECSVLLALFILQKRKWKIWVKFILFYTLCARGNLGTRGQALWFLLLCHASWSSLLWLPCWCQGWKSGEEHWRLDLDLLRGIQNPMVWIQKASNECLTIPQLIAKTLWCPHWCSLQMRGQQFGGRRWQWSLLWLWGLCSHLGPSPTSLQVQTFEQSSWWARRERQRRGDFCKAVYQNGKMFSCNDWKRSLTRRQPAGGGRTPAFLLYFSKRTETGLLTGSRQSLINWLIYGRWKELWQSAVCWLLPP